MLASSTAVRVGAFVSVCVVALIVVVSVLVATTRTTTFVAPTTSPSPTTHTPTPAVPVPTPTPTDPVLPLPPTGLWCTYPPDFYQTVNTSCYPNSTYANVNGTYCQAMRNVTDKACFMAACFSSTQNSSTPGLQLMPFTQPEVQRSSRIDFAGSNISDDSGPVHLLDLVVKFMLDNIPDSIDPIEPPPEPFDFGVTLLNLDATNYNNDYQISSRELARQMSAFEKGLFMSLRFTNNSTDLRTAVSNSRLTIVANTRTSRCNNIELAAIEWLTTNVTFSQLSNLLTYLPTLNVSNSQCDPANWPAECLYWTSGDTHYCSQFGTYYTFTSLRNFTELPSPWRDLTTIATALNNEYALCGAPAGCFGSIA